MLNWLICIFLGHRWRTLPGKWKIKCKRCGAESEFIDVPYGHAMNGGI